MSISKNNFKRLYVLYVEPHLEYASVVWDPCLIYIEINKLEAVQQYNLHVNYVPETGIGLYIYFKRSALTVTQCKEEVLKNSL